MRRFKLYFLGTRVHSHINICVELPYTGLEADLLSGILDLVLYALKGEVRAHIRYCTGLEADLVSGILYALLEGEVRPHIPYRAGGRPAERDTVRP
eukprot:COSAG02_NODE_2876_length_7843_cov_12.285382_7_plen_96_part_00